MREQTVRAIVWDSRGQYSRFDVAVWRRGVRGVEAVGAAARHVRHRPPEGTVLLALHLLNNSSTLSNKRPSQGQDCGANRPLHRNQMRQALPTAPEVCHLIRKMQK